MSEVNDFNLSQQDLKEFKLKSVKKLLEQLNNSSATETDFMKLDNKDSKMSKAEEKLYDQLKENSDMVNFLE